MERRRAAVRGRPPGHAPAPDEVRDLADYLAAYRSHDAAEPFDIVVGGRSDVSTAADVIRPLQQAGATWWDERIPQTDPDHYRADPVLRRIEAGPPGTPRIR